VKVSIRKATTPKASMVPKSTDVASSKGALLKTISSKVASSRVIPVKADATPKIGAPTKVGAPAKAIVQKSCESFWAEGWSTKNWRQAEMTQCGVRRRRKENR
jgi:hypothetical protein